MVRSQARTMERRPEHCRSVGRVLFHHITTSWLISFGDRTDSWCRHTRATVLITIQVHAYAQSSEGSAAWSCDVPCRRNSVRSGQPGASDAIVPLQPPSFLASPRGKTSMNMSREKLLEAVASGS